MLLQFEGMAFAHRALRIEIEQLRSGIAYLSGGFLFGLVPLAAAEIVQQVARRELPRESGVAQLVEFFNLDPARADRLMGAVGKTFFIEAPEPAPQQAPAPAKKEPPA